VVLAGLSWADEKLLTGLRDHQTSLGSFNLFIKWMLVAWLWLLL